MSTQTMTVRLLILQRKGAYEGQCAPEVLSVVDEVTLDENAEWWIDEVVKQKQSVGTDADAWAEIEVDLPLDAIRNALYPSPQVTASDVRPVVEA